MGHKLCLHFGADEHPCTTYFDVHQGYRVLTHSQVTLCVAANPSAACLAQSPKLRSCPFAISFVGRFPLVAMADALTSLGKAMFDDAARRWFSFSLCFGVNWGLAGIQASV